jgi:hypothetical protein
MYQGRKDTGHPQRLLERLLGRRTDALTNFFTNLGIVLRHLQNGVVFLQREALIGNCLRQGIDGLIRDALLVDEVVEKIVRALAVKLTHGEGRRLGRRGTSNVEAYETWLRARELAGRSTREAIAQHAPPGPTQVA